MRHVLGLLFGLILAPVTWFLASLGHFRFLDALQRFGDDPDKLPTELAFGAILIVAAGAWLGVLLSSRLSPLAPAICGLAWLGLGAAYVVNVERLTELLPNGPTGQVGIFVLPLENGYAFLVGTALMSPLFSPARWRGGQKKSAVDDLAEAPTATGRTATGAYPMVVDPDAVPADQPSWRARAARTGCPADATDLASSRGAGQRAEPGGYRSATPPPETRSYRDADRATTAPAETRGYRDAESPADTTGYRGADRSVTPLSDAPSYRGAARASYRSDDRDPAGYGEQPTGGQRRPEPPLPWEQEERARHRSPDR
jgi:hypothetical protein